VITVREVSRVMGPYRTAQRCALALAIGVIFAIPAPAAESFRKLKDAEIKAKLAGMEVGDGVHWAEQYMRDGTFRAFHMGKPSKGKWTARNGQLCLDHGKPDPECMEVWLSGNKVEFRGTGSGMPAVDGVLQKQQPRQ
jgi:hypothetical protein